MSKFNASQYPTALPVRASVPASYHLPTSARAEIIMAKQRYQDNAAISRYLFTGKCLVLTLVGTFYLLPLLGLL